MGDSWGWNLQGNTFIRITPPRGQGTGNAYTNAMNYWFELLLLSGNSSVLQKASCVRGVEMMQASHWSRQRPDAQNTDIILHLSDSFDPTLSLLHSLITSSKSHPVTSSQRNLQVWWKELLVDQDHDWYTSSAFCFIHSRFPSLLASACADDSTSPVE